MYLLTLDQDTQILQMIDMQGWVKHLDIDKIHVHSVMSDHSVPEHTVMTNSLHLLGLPKDSLY